MKIHYILSAVAMFSLSAGVVVADEAQIKEKTKIGEQSAEKKTTVKGKSESGTDKMKIHEVLGTVKEYDAGKAIKVTLEKGDNESFSLDKKDTRVVVDSGVKVGSMVKVTHKKDDKGVESLTVQLIK